MRTLILGAQEKEPSEEMSNFHLNSTRDPLARETLKSDLEKGVALKRDRDDHCLQL